MNLSTRNTVLSAALLCVVACASAHATTHSENFEGASGNANAYSSASGMHFSTSGGSFIFSTQFNSYFSPYIAGKFVTTGCNGCLAATMTVAWPAGQRSLVFGWGTQGYTAVRVTAFRDGQQVWVQNQSGTANSGLYKQQFSRTAANAGEYFDEVAITFPGGGQAGMGYGILLDNFTSTDAYAALSTTGGSQIAAVTEAYAKPLSVVVHDYQNHPVAGVEVDFSAPSDGGGTPTVLFDATHDTFDVAITDANGVAVSSPMSANTSVGPFTVAVSTSPTVGAAVLTLRNVSADTIFIDTFE